jgi:hypothetical protein
MTKINPGLSEIWETYLGKETRIKGSGNCRLASTITMHRGSRGCFGFFNVLEKEKKNSYKMGGKAGRKAKDMISDRENGK